MADPADNSGTMSHRSTAFAVGALALLVVLIIILAAFLPRLLAGRCAPGPTAPPLVTCRIDKATNDQAYSAKPERDTDGNMQQMGAMPADADGNAWDLSPYGGYGKVGDDNKKKRGPYGQGGGDPGSVSNCRARCTPDVENYDTEAGGPTQQGCVAYTYSESACKPSNSQCCFLWTEAPPGLVAVSGDWGTYIKPEGVETYAA